MRYGSAEHKARRQAASFNLEPGEGTALLCQDLRLVSYVPGILCCIYGDLLDRAETRHSHVAMLAILAG